MIEKKANCEQNTAQIKSNNAKKILSLLQRTFFIVFVSIGIIIAGLQIVPRIMGYKPYVIISGSMEPEHKAGDLVFVKKTDPESIKEGDIISFKTEAADTIITHRVVETYRNEKYFTTKGDANDKVDQKVVGYDDIIGTVRFSIPFVGFCYIILSWPSGQMLISAVILLLILCLYVLPELFISNGKVENGAKKSEEETPAIQNDKPENVPLK